MAEVDRRLKSAQIGEQSSQRAIEFLQRTQELKSAAGIEVPIREAKASEYPNSPQWRREILNMRANGVSVDEIAEISGVSKTTISKQSQLGMREYWEDYPHAGLRDEFPVESLRFPKVPSVKEGHGLLGVIMSDSTTFEEKQEALNNMPVKDLKKEVRAENPSIHSLRKFIYDMGMLVGEEDMLIMTQLLRRTGVPVGIIVEERKAGSQAPRKYFPFPAQYKDQVIEQVESTF